MYKIENTPLIRTSYKGSPIRDALAETLANLKVGQSFEVPVKGHLALALKVAKELGIGGIITSPKQMKVGKVDPATIKPRKTKQPKQPKQPK